jgi:hypothetical protein
MNEKRSWINVHFRCPAVLVEKFDAKSEEFGTRTAAFHEAMRHFIKTWVPAEAKKEV